MLMVKVFTTLFKVHGEYAENDKLWSRDIASRVLRSSPRDQALYLESHKWVGVGCCQSSYLRRRMLDDGEHSMLRFVPHATKNMAKILS